MIFIIVLVRLFFAVVLSILFGLFRAGIFFSRKERGFRVFWGCMVLSIGFDRFGGNFGLVM